MEEQLERKETSTNPREPIKSERLMQSPNTSERSDGAASPPPNCSICLGKLVNTSFTDSCLHQFCFTCLLEWSKIKTECPLCKQTFKSIIHNVRSEEDYDQYHVPRQFASQMPQSQVAATLDVNFDLVGMNVDVGLRRFVYRTTMTPNRRYGMLLNSDQVTRLNVPSQISREERRRRRANPTDYRRNVYRYGVWSTSLPDIFGRFRGCSAEYYRRQPSELTRLVPWLNRELQVLLSDDAPHVAYVMNIIMDALSQFDMRSPEFRHIIRPYFSMHTDHFVHELLNYARTSFSLAGYDQCVTYVPSHGLSNEYVSHVYTSSSSSITSDDSDVRVVDETIDMSRLNAELPTYLPHRMDIPGPSTVGQAMNIQTVHSYPDVLTISSDSSLSSDNECEVVGYVKPRHEIRTPEIVELSSTDVEEVNTSSILHDDIKYENPIDLNTCQQFLGSTSLSLPGDDTQPSTSHVDKKETTRKTNCRVARSRTSKFSSSSTDDSDSDSSCSPERRKKSKSNSTRSKVSSRNSQIRQSKWLSDTRKRNKASRISLSSDESECENRSDRNERKVIKLEVEQEAKKRYSSSSSDSSVERSEKQTRDKDKSNSIKLRKDLTKRKEKYIKSDSSRSKSSSESDSNRRKVERPEQEGKKRYLSNSSSSSLERNEKRTRNQDKVTKCDDVIGAVKTRKDLRKREDRYTKDKLSNKGNVTETTYKPQRGKKSESKRYYSTDEYDKEQEIRKNTNRYDSQDDNDSVKRESRRRNNVDYSTSDSERNLLGIRSSSQCSIRSDKTYASKKKSKHKEKHKDKREKHSSSKSVALCQSVTNSAAISSSSRNDMPSTSIHSDSKNSLNSKGRHKSHKKHKESRHRKSRSESKCKSKKKKRRVKSSSPSNSNNGSAHMRVVTNL